MQVYMTVCVEGHNLTLVAADGLPLTPRVFKECVDVNSGQRMDVLLKANNKPDKYWCAAPLSRGWAGGGQVIFGPEPQHRAKDQWAHGRSQG